MAKETTQTRVQGLRVTPLVIQSAINTCILQLQCLEVYAPKMFSFSGGEKKIPVYKNPQTKVKQINKKHVYLI